MVLKPGSPVRPNSTTTNYNTGYKADTFCYRPLWLQGPAARCRTKCAIGHCNKNRLRTIDLPLIA